MAIDLRSRTRFQDLTASSPQQPELALQGSLFGLEPAAEAAEADRSSARSAKRSKRAVGRDLPCDGDALKNDPPTGEPLNETALNAEALADDANRRPRQRKQSPSLTTAPADDSVDPEATAEPSDSDLPPWHHHSLVDAQQLTPMLRHYVELKAAHPERVLLYRLGDFFECFFEDAIQL